MTDLDYTVFDGSDVSFNKASVIVAGGDDAVLVDATFTRTDGSRLLAELQATGKNLTTVVITAPDPDYYFAGEQIAEAFPQARFVAPADVRDQIQAKYQSKIETWGHLGDELPSRLVDIEVLDGPISVDGAELEVRRDVDSLGTRGWYVWQADDHALLGGVLLFQGLHVWTADSGTPEARQQWRAALDALTAHRPAYVVAGHRVAGAPTGTEAIEWTRSYLEFFERTVAQSANAETAERALLDSYPDAGLAVAANLGTKVALGEMQWG